MNSEDLEFQREEQEEKKSKIEKANETLYQPGAPMITRAPHGSSFSNTEEEKPVSADWQSSYKKSHILDSDEATDKIGKLFRKLLKFAIGFFVLAVGVSAFVYFYGNNTISSRNISIIVNSPPSVASSDQFSFDISVENGNNADLIDSSIIIDYPEGSRSSGEDTMPLINQKIEVGTLSKGQVSQQTASARLFGAENSNKKIDITFQYRLAGSDTTFSKKTSFDVALRLAPVVLSVDALKEVNNNQEVVLTAKILSNSNNTLKNAVLNVSYPYGFTFTESNMEVSSGARGEFPLGDLLPNDVREVVIKGTISGQSAEDKIFKFRAGTSDSADSSKISTLLVSYDHDMVLASDFLATTITFNNNAKVIEAGDIFRGVISWRNTLEVPLTDAEFSLRISGNLMEENDIVIEKGYYDSSNMVAFWNKSINPELAQISPGETSQFRFNIPLSTYKQAVAENITNPSLNFTLDIQAKRLTDFDVTEDIESSFSQRVPILTSIDMVSKSLSTTGVLKNSGPIPPKAGQKTTYSAVISLSNSLSNVSGGEVTTTLPVYVTYEGEFSPQSEKVSWNPNTRQIRWSVGNIRARTGYDSSPRTLSFKVGINPSKTQVGTTPVLVQDIKFVGHDDFASADITSVAKQINTSAEDPGFVFGNDKVVE